MEATEQTLYVKVTAIYVAGLGRIPTEKYFSSAQLSKHLQNGVNTKKCKEWELDLKSNLCLTLENQAEVSIAKAANIASGCSPPHMSKQRKGLPSSDTALTLTINKILSTKITKYFALLLTFHEEHR